MKQNQPKIYLAGPDVFYPDAIERGQRLKRLCAEKGMQGLFPFDNQLPVELAPEKASDYIFKANMHQLVSADALLVNLNYFRGHEPDSGTVYELAVGYALQKPVWVYFDPQGSMIEHIPNRNGTDHDGNAVEDFGNARNLMLAHSWTGCSPSAEQAIADLAHFLKSTDDGSKQSHGNDLFTPFAAFVESLPA